MNYHPSYEAWRDEAQERLHSENSLGGYLRLGDSTSLLDGHFSSADLRIIADAMDALRARKG